MTFKNILVVYNPKSGRFTPKKLLFIQDFLKKNGVSFTALNSLQDNIDKTTTAPFDAVFVVGGDGTLNNIINRLAFTDIPIAHIPMGTVNLFALENKTPFFLKKALGTILDTYKPVKTNIGKINGRFFLSMAGIGFDAFVVKNVEEETNRKNLSNQAVNNHVKYLGYIKKIINASKNYEFPEIYLTVEDEGSNSFDFKEPLNANQIIVANLKYYGGPFKLFPESSCLNDNFSIRILNNLKQRKDIISSIIKFIIFKNGYKTDPKHYFKAKKISICAVDPDRNRNIYYQCDGEFAGSLPAHIEKVESAVTLLASPNLR